jgi:hypothetical protein
MTPAEVVKALDLIADYYNPRYGRWAYRAFDAINASFFEGRLSRPLIQWALTAHGACLGLTRHRYLVGLPDETALWGRPVITLHPSIMDPWVPKRHRLRLKGPWAIDWNWFGPLYAFDVLLHESIHVAQRALYGPAENKGESSHNCPSWIAEVNRLAPLLGMERVEAGLNRPRRVPIPGQLTRRGKPKTKVKRVDEGNIPLSVHSRFPDALRVFFGTADAYYRAKVLPCGITLDL